MQSAAEIKRTARQAGLLYLALSILAIIGYFYLRPRFIISGDPTATARNILANEPLYRVGILIDVTAQLLFIFVIVALYRLFEDVDRTQTRILVALVAIGIAAQFATFVFNTAPLIFLSGAGYLSAFTRPQLETLAYTSLGMAGREGQLLTSIWGLWLFPFAVLTIKSGFLPKFLGVLLILSGAAYVVSFVIGLVSPALVSTVYTFALPLYFGEFIVVLWLAFMGAKPRAAEAQPPLQVT